MTAIASRSTKLSQVLAFEDNADKGYCRETATVTVAAGMDVGAALVKVGAKYEWISQAELTAGVPTQVLTDGVAVLVDHYAGVNKLTAGDHQLAVLVRGPAGVTAESLTFADAVDATGKAAVVAQLVKQGIVNREQV